MSETDELQQDESVDASPSPVAEDKPSPPERHVDTRSLVFPDLKILYVPVPKAGCTAVMWALADVAGIEKERFYSSYYREVSRSLTIHDLSVWPDEFLYTKLSQEQKDEILKADDWLRFTAVRHPFRRLWSAWQSKILLGEPQFAEKFGDRSWFPKSVASAQDVLKTFRRFLEALEEDHELVNADVHWAPQVELIALGDVPYTYVGRVEKLDETVAIVRDHVASVTGGTLPDLGRSNVAPLPYVDELFDEADVRILGSAFADDLKEFEYDRPSDDALERPVAPTWIAAVDAMMPALDAIRHRNERVGDLQQLFRSKREELNGRIAQQKNRIEQQKNRIEQQKNRIDTQRETIDQQKARIARQSELRAEEQRRNARLQERLRKTTRELDRIKSSTSWRYTAPLRRLSALPRKALRRRRRG